MSEQRTFGDLAWGGKKEVTRREQFLAEMDAVVPWAEFVRLVTPVYPKGERGRPVMPLRVTTILSESWAARRAPAWQRAIGSGRDPRRA
jgi:IS5 family transposase